MRLLAVDQDLAKHSYYAATAPRGAAHAPLDGDVRCDVAIVGVGAAKKVSGVRWGVANGIVMAWVITIPCAAAISATSA